MNFEEIKNKLEDLGITKDDFAYQSFSGQELKDQFGEVIEVLKEGGEGKGESWSVVRHFVDHNVYIRLDGFYTSYDGTDFGEDELVEVFPKEKTITVYES